ncbi:hypothetical protein F2Q70_00021222 [Brassica cretica]|uniref:C3H1-type domain-containing protein n=1 Tax=Brassica cretica TaxID=69181 RepID=A0A8S9GRX7_BRACR|nr:hypothetical protein F2Q70_00021222 [Brassica cretica]
MNKATNLDRERSEPKTTSDERIPSDYPVRPGESSCRSYLHSGLCVRGSNCLFNHPRCKFFLRGFCKDGSACKFLHSKDNEAPMRQIDYGQEEKETKDWVFNIEKKYNLSLSQICDGIVAGYKRAKMGKRRGSQENVKEHRQRENTGWQRYFEKKRREAQEHDKLDKKRQRDVEKMEIEAEESSEEQRLKDFQGLERFKDISQIHDEIVAGYIRPRKMVKIFEESGEEQRLKVFQREEGAEYNDKPRNGVNNSKNSEKRIEEAKREDDTRTYSAGTESISMEETKERDLDSRSRKSDVTTDRRHKRDPGTWAEKREPDLITDHKESYVVDTLKQQRLGDVEMQQQRSHETESKNRATNLGWERSEPKTISDERIQNGYQVRPGERICRSYLQTGLCDHGSNCLFNHPTCKFFRRGFCTDSSACKFIHAKNNEAPRLPNNTMRQPLPSDVKILPEFSHPKDRDGAETMRQGSGRHETESAYRPDEKKCNSSLSQISVVGMVAGSSSYKEKEQRQAHDDPLELRDNTEWQRGQAQENVHEHRPRDITDCQRYYEMGRRDAQEIVQQHRQRDITEFLRYFEMGRRDAQVIVQQHRQREASGRQRYLEEEKSEAQENDQEQRLMVTTLDGRFDERRHETESSSMAEKREELFTSLQSRFKDVIDDIAAGYERVGTEHGEGNVGRQRVEAEEIVQEQSNRGGDVL